MARRGPLPRPLQTVARHAALALVWAFGASGPAIAEPVETGAKAAAFTACAGAPMSLEVRLKALNDAGWKIAEDTPETRDLFGLIFASGYRFWSYTISNKHRKAALEGQGSPPPISAVIWQQANGRPGGVQLKPGKPVDVEATLASARENVGKVEAFFTYGDGGTILQVLALPSDINVESFTLFCNLFTSEQLDLGNIPKLLPKAVKPADLRSERKYEQQYELTLISFRTTSGYAGKLTHLDATTLEPLKTYQTRTGSKAKISTILSFDSRSVPLKN
jgi:hypothetical protein